MRRDRVLFSLAAALLVPAGLTSPVMGGEATPIEPTTWLNAKTPVTWKSLKGRVILVEKWATW